MRRQPAEDGVQFGNEGLEGVLFQGLVRRCLPDAVEQEVLREKLPLHAAPRVS